MGYKIINYKRSNPEIFLTRGTIKKLRTIPQGTTKLTISTTFINENDGRYVWLNKTDDIKKSVLAVMDELCKLPEHTFCISCGKKGGW